jgi:hypothetical protein
MQAPHCGEPHRVELLPGLRALLGMSRPPMPGQPRLQRLPIAPCAASRLAAPQSITTHGSRRSGTGPIHQQPSAPGPYSNSLPWQGLTAAASHLRHPCRAFLLAGGLPDVASLQANAEVRLPLDRAKSILRSKLREGGWQLVVTGHSLGAAVACMLAFHLREDFPGRCWV